MGMHHQSSAWEHHQNYFDVMVSGAGGFAGRRIRSVKIPGDDFLRARLALEKDFADGEVAAADEFFRGGFKRRR